MPPRLTQVPRQKLRLPAILGLYFLSIKASYAHKKKKIKILTSNKICIPFLLLIWSFVSLICRSQSLNIEARGKSFLPYNVKFGFIRFFVLHTYWLLISVDKSPSPALSPFPWLSRIVPLNVLIIVTPPWPAGGSYQKPPGASLLYFQNPSWPASYFCDSHDLSALVVLWHYTF